MWKSTSSYELVVSPVLLALVGYGLDRLFGTLPIITIVFAVVGLTGAVTIVYYRYRAEMDEHEAALPSKAVYRRAGERSAAARARSEAA